MTLISVMSMIIDMFSGTGDPVRRTRGDLILRARLMLQRGLTATNTTKGDH